MKETLKPIFYFIIWAIIPYLIVSLIHGNNFNMNNWNGDETIYYLIFLLVFGGLIFIKR